MTDFTLEIDEQQDCLRFEAKLSSLVGGLIDQLEGVDVDLCPVDLAAEDRTVALIQIRLKD
jgi:hypothetical protein